MTDVNTALAALLALIEKANKPTMGNKGQSSGIRRNPKYKSRAKPTSAGNDLLSIAAFNGKGYKDLTPDNVRSLVKTYGKIKPDGSKSGWLAEGRKVMAGQKGIKVGPYTLFHKEQTEVIGAEQPKAVVAEQPKMVAVPVLSEDDIVAQAKLILAARMAARASEAAMAAEYGPSVHA